MACIMMEETADFAIVQQAVTDTLNEEHNPQKVIA